MSFEICTSNQIILKHCNKFINKSGYTQAMLCGIIGLYENSNNKTATIDSKITNISEALKYGFRLKDIMNIIPSFTQEIIQQLTSGQKTKLCSALRIIQDITNEELFKYIEAIRNNNMSLDMFLKYNITPANNFSDIRGGFYVGIIQRFVNPTTHERFDWTESEKITNYIKPLLGNIITDETGRIIRREPGKLTMGYLFNTLIGLCSNKAFTIIGVRNILDVINTHENYKYNESKSLWYYVFYPFIIDLPVPIPVTIPKLIDTTIKLQDLTVKLEDSTEIFINGNLQFKGKISIEGKDYEINAGFMYLHFNGNHYCLFKNKLYIYKNGANRLLFDSKEKIKYIVYQVLDPITKITTNNNIFDSPESEKKFTVKDDKLLYDGKLFYHSTLLTEGYLVFNDNISINGTLYIDGDKLYEGKLTLVDKKILLNGMLEPTSLTYKNLIEFFRYHTYSEATAAQPKDEEHYDPSKGTSSSHIGFASIHFPMIVSLFKSKFIPMHPELSNITPKLAALSIPGFKKNYSSWLERDTTKPVLQIPERRNAFVDLIAKGILDTFRFDPISDDDPSKDTRNKKFGYTHSELFLLIYLFICYQPEYVQTTWAVRTLSDSIDAKNEDVSLATLQVGEVVETTCQTGIIERFYTTIGDIYCEPYKLSRKRITDNKIVRVRELMKLWLEQYMRLPKETTFFDVDEFNRYVDRQIYERRVQQLDEADMDWENGKRELSSLDYYGINDRPNADDLSELLNKLLRNKTQTPENIELLRRYVLVQRKYKDLLNPTNITKLKKIKSILNQDLVKIIKELIPDSKPAPVAKNSATSTPLEQIKEIDGFKKYLLYDGSSASRPNSNIWQAKYLKYANAKGISLEQVFYKKYLLYKKKYLELKNNIN